MSASIESFAPEFRDFLENEGFVISKSLEKPEEFGNTSIILESPKLKIRIYSDRGQRFVDVGSIGQDWHKLEYVLEFVEPACSQQWFGEPPQLDKLAVALKRNISAISGLLSGDLATSGFTMFEKKKSNKLIEKIFKKPK